MVDINSAIHINSPNTPTKEKLSESFEKQDPSICVYTKFTLNIDIYRLKVKGCRKYHTNTKKKLVVAMLISERADFRARKVIRGKEWQYVMIKRSINLYYFPRVAI